MIRMRPGQKIVMLDGTIRRLHRVMHSWEPAGVYRIDYWTKEGRRTCLAWYRNGWWKEYPKPPRKPNPWLNPTEPSSNGK